MMNLNEEQTEEYRKLRRELNTAQSVDEANGIYSKILTLIEDSKAAVVEEPVDIKQLVREFLREFKSKNEPFNALSGASLELVAARIQGWLNVGIITEKQALEIVKNEFEVFKSGNY